MVVNPTDSGKRRLEQYRVADLLVDVGRQRVTRADSELDLPKLSFDLLLVLIRAAPNLVSNDELMARVWPGLVVSPETVSQRVKLLRDALGDDPREPRYIAGLRGRGYRLLPEVEVVEERRNSAQEAAQTALVEATPSEPVPAAQVQPVTSSASPMIRGRKRLIATTLAWFHGLRAQHRVSGSELLILTALLVLAGSVLWLLGRPNHERVPAQTVALAPALSGAAATAIARPPENSVAVLPFVDMSEKKDQEYFGDGMGEAILDLLVKIPGVAVIGRTSSYQFKGRNEDLRAIGASLNAAYVLEGSVRNSGDRVRITAQLVNTRTGRQEWSETYDRQIGDVLRLQDAIAAAVVRELQITVAPDLANTGSTPKNAEAYDLYLRGRHAYDRRDDAGVDEAATLFQRALDRDPTFADAAVWLALTKEYQGELHFMPPADAFEQARRAALTALKLDPKSATAHALLGFIHTIYDWDWAAAEREFREAATLAPGSTDAHMERVLSLTYGRWDDALRQTNAWLAQDPLNPARFRDLYAIQAIRGHLPEAEAAARRALDIRPTLAWGHYALGRALLARGERNAALLEMQQETTDQGKQQGLAMVYYALGSKAESDAALAAMLKDQADRNAMGIADVYAFRGQTDEAMHWLERAYAQKDPELFRIKSQTELKSLTADPRYTALLRKMNLPE